MFLAVIFEFFLLCCLNSIESRAAEMRVTPTCFNPQLNATCQRSRDLWIIGEIKSGDFETFKRLLVENGNHVQYIMLRSPGGNVAVAMDIGRLIRKLYLYTMAPVSEEETHHCSTDIQHLGTTTPCTCASACFLVFVGGLMRVGEAIYLHRIKFDSEMFSSLNFTDAANLYSRGMDNVHAYLTEMNIPDKYFDLMYKVSSNQVIRLTFPDSDELNHWDPAFNEWLLAKCPLPFGSNGSAIGPNADCRNKAIFALQTEAFRTVLGVDMN